MAAICILNTKIRKDIYILPNGFSSPFVFNIKIIVQIHQNTSLRISSLSFLSFQTDLVFVWMRCLSFTVLYFYTNAYAPPNYVSVGLYKYRSCILMTISSTYKQISLSICFAAKSVSLLQFFYHSQHFYNAYCAAYLVGCVSVSLEDTLMEILKLLGYQVCLFYLYQVLTIYSPNDCVNLFSH